MELSNNVNHYLFLDIPANKTITINTNNPLWLFISSTDSDYAIRFISNTTINIIAGTLPSSVTFSRPTNKTLTFTNGLPWNIHAWILQ